MSENNKFDLKEKNLEEETLKDITESPNNEEKTEISDSDADKYQKNKEILPKNMAEKIKEIKTEEEIKKYLENNHSIDIAESFKELNDDELLYIFELMGAENKARILEQAGEELQIRILNLISDKEAIDVFRCMSPDDIADILGYIDIKKSKSILNNMKFSEANKIRELLGYEEDTAGGIMTTQYIAFKQNLEIKDVMIKLKSIAPKSEVIETIFVINEKKELVGKVDLREILISSEETRLEQIMNENIEYVFVEEDQEDVARMVSKYDLNVIPVINHKKNILGIITVDDIIDVIQEENTEDILKLGGVSEEEDIHSPFLFSVKQRLPWLIVNLGTAFLASFVIGIFSNTVEKVVILSSMMTIISGMGGNAGTQSLSVTIRALALGEINTNETLKIVGKNILVGVITGSILGILCGAIMYFIFGNFYLGLIIFLAMIGNLVLACIIGFLVPVTLKALKIDPAMASAVLLTTVTDTCGFFLFLGLATVFLNKLI